MSANVNGEGSNAVDAAIAAQAERLAKRAGEDKPADPAPVDPATIAAPQKVFEFHLEAYDNGNYKISAPKFGPEQAMATLTIVAETVAKVLAQAEFQRAIQKAQAMVPQGQMPVWQRIRKSFQGIMGQISK